MLEWNIKLKGNKTILNDLILILDSEDITFFEKNDEFFCNIEKLNRLEDARKVHENAIEIITYINGISKIYYGDPFTIEFDCLEKYENGKHIGSFNFFEDVVKVSDRTNFIIGEIPKERKLLLKKLYPFKSWISYASKNQNTAKVLRLYSSKEHNWDNLFKIYEVVKADIGNNFENLNIVQKDQLIIFRRSAQHPFVSGDEARHGYSTEEPPENPMTLSEANSFIISLIKNWLNYIENI